MVLLKKWSYVHVYNIMSVCDIECVWYGCVYDIMGVFDIMNVCVCVISWVCVWYYECMCDIHMNIAWNRSFH